MMNGEVGSAEHLISALWTLYGEEASNAAIWFLLQDDSENVMVFLAYMEKLCSLEVVTTCAKILRDHETMPRLSQSSIDQLFNFDIDGDGGEWP